MPLLSKSKDGAFLLLFRERQWPHVFKKIAYDEADPPLDPSAFHPYNDDSASVFSLRLMPSYFRHQIDDSKYGIRCVNQHNWGYAVDLRTYHSADDYLMVHFNSSARKGVRRFVKRLEHCLEVSYELYYGHMDPNTYQFLMDSLKAMIVDRFQRKGVPHKELPHWQKLTQETHNQILRKEASLFVIYHEEKPIQISLNYHMGKILFSSIASFDIDYSKFGLGHIEIYKQIDWCCKNGYTIYEMGVGGTAYKEKWSNLTYNFQHLIISKKQHLLGRVVAFLELIRVTTKEFLKSIGINEIHQKLHIIRSKPEAFPEKTKLSKIMPLEEKEPNESLHLKRVPPSCSNFDLIKEYVYNFLYTTQEQEKGISVYQTSDGKYLIQGKRYFQTLEFKSLAA